MKTSFTFIIWIITCLIGLAQERLEATLFVNNETRNLVIFKPSGIPPPGGYPLVFMLHGTNQSGSQFYNISGWKEVAEREKFIVVFPTALIYCTTEGIVTKWSHGNTLSLLCPGDTLRDDIPFFYKMIDTISSVIPINSKKIFACGFSSGGTMVPKLTIKMPGVFAAAACGSGNLDSKDSMPMNPKVPTWAIRGTHDHNFIEKLGRPCPFNDTSLAFNAAQINPHLGSMGLSSTYKKDSNSYYINYTFTEPLPNEAPTFFRWSIFYGLEHEFFNGINYLSNIPNPPIEAELFWEFFKTASIINSTDKGQKGPSIIIFPNPSTDEIQIKIPKYLDSPIKSLQLFDAMGQMIYSQTIHSMDEVNLKKSQFGKGIYFLKLNNSSQSFASKFIFN